MCYTTEQEMRTMFTGAAQTMKQVYQEIAIEGKDPWIALGNFMNSWYGDHKRRRKALIKDPLDLPTEPTQEQLRWATFCAASVEYFCQKYHLSCPKWTSNPTYERLTDAWYYSHHAHLVEVRKELEDESPEPFKRRNIFVSRRIYANKYEIAEDLQSRRITDPGCSDPLHTGDQTGNGYVDQKGC
jgi:hypothetical protein